ncbi:MAG: DUF4349 domain-containing protein [Bacteroidales bacterium]|nr:DUF4349 domain-containing protein [Bacteroidales bacterium]
MKASISLWISFFILLISCANKTDSTNTTEETRDVVVSNQNNSQHEEHGLGIFKPDRKFIKEGSLLFETKNITEAKNYIEEQVRAHQGFISKEFARDFANEKEYTMEVRIPCDKFDDFVKKLDPIIFVLKNKDIQVYEVTKEYVDLETRLKTKQEIKKHYEELLKHARNISEIMQIQQKIDSLQLDIESLQGRLSHLQNQVQYSTLSITFYEPKMKKTFFWKRAKENFLEGWHILIWIVQAIITLWPIWLITIIIILIYNYSKKKKRSLSSSDNLPDKNQ